MTREMKEEILQECNVLASKLRMALEDLEEVTHLIYKLDELKCELIERQMECDPNHNFVCKLDISEKEKNLKDPVMNISTKYFILN